MPQKAWAVGEEVLAADFNTYLQNQCVPQFTGTAQRDAQWAAPPNGAMCTTTDSNALWQRVGGVWVQSYGNVYASTAARQFMQYGTISAPTGATGNLGITFPVAYTTITNLIVVACPGDTSGGLASCAVTGLATTGFTVICFSATAQLGASVTVRVNWHSIGTP